MAKGFIKEEESRPVVAGSGKKQYYVGPSPSKAGSGRGVVNQPAINSKEQYLSEKEAGDPNALNLSFEEWKKL